MIRPISSLVLAACVFASVAHATVSVDTNGLTESQKAELVQMAERMRATPTSEAGAIGNLTPERVGDWAQLGKDIALAFTTVAKEMGIAADQFLASTTGKVTLALIIWKVAGQDILHIGIGICFLFTFVPLWIYFFRRLCLMKSVVKTPVDGHRLRQTTIEYFGDDAPTDIVITRWVMLVVLVVIVVGGLAIAL